MGRSADSWVTITGISALAFYALLLVLTGLAAFQVNLAPGVWLLLALVISTVGGFLIASTGVKKSLEREQRRGSATIEDSVTEMTDTWKIRADLGLRVPDNEVHKISCTPLKYLRFSVFVTRLLLNGSYLIESFGKLSLVSSMSNFTRVARAVECYCFAGSLTVVVVQSAFGACGVRQSWWTTRAHLKNVAGFSSLKFLMYCDFGRAVFRTKVLYDKHAQTGSTLDWEADHEDKKAIDIILICFMIIYLPIFLFLGVLGAAVFVDRLAEFDFESMSSSGISGMLAELWSTIVGGKRQVAMETNIVRFFALLNQLVSLRDQDESEMDRILKYMFAREDSRYDKEEDALRDDYLDELGAKLVRAGRIKGAVALLTFGPDDLQKLPLQKAPRRWRPSQQERRPTLHQRDAPAQTTYGRRGAGVDDAEIGIELAGAASLALISPLP